MAFAATGELAIAVSKAGGLGLIGGAYGDADWVREQFSVVGDQNVGCGFITWALEEAVLEETLAQNPSALMLSFGNPAAYASSIRSRQIPLICQIQTYADAQCALDCGADIIVAQGAEAGGHGDKRSTFTLVPEVRDLIDRAYPDALLCAAGGIADGRGIAAALMLGADGVLMGSRLWASVEADVSRDMHEAVMQASGDATLRTSVVDVVRNLDWSERYTARVLKNEFTERWHYDLDGLRKAPESVARAWKQAWDNGDPQHSNTFIGEVTGLLNTIEPVATLIDRAMSEAEELLGKGWT